MCIVVAYYFPPGNIVEEFEENVGVVEDNVDGVLTNETRTPVGIMAEYGQYGKWQVIIIKHVGTQTLIGL